MSGRRRGVVGASSVRYRGTVGADSGHRLGHFGPTSVSLRCDFGGPCGMHHVLGYTCYGPWAVSHEPRTTSHMPQAISYEPKAIRGAATGRNRCCGGTTSGWYGDTTGQHTAIMCEPQADVAATRLSQGGHNTAAGRPRDEHETTTERPRDGRGATTEQSTVHSRTRREGCEAEAGTSGNRGSITAQSQKPVG